jgi:hypothetical protein
MSRIDYTKNNSGSGSVIPQGRMDRVLSRGASPLSGNPGLAPGLVRAVQPFVQERAIEKEEARLPSVSEIQDADLAAIAGMGAEQLAGELCRIDVLLKDSRALIDDPDLQQAFDIGTTMLGESIRRLRLVQGGQDSLILG